MVHSISDIGLVVKQILMDSPACRDNDRKLMLKVWVKQNPALQQYGTYLLHTFALDFLDGKYVDPSSISRARRKLQEAFPQLRGDNYHKRQNRKGQNHKQYLTNL